MTDIFDLLLLSDIWAERKDASTIFKLKSEFLLQKQKNLAFIMSASPSKDELLVMKVLSSQSQPRAAAGLLGSALEQRSDFQRLLQFPDHINER